MNNSRIEAVFIFAGSVAFSVAFFLSPSVMLDGIRRGLAVCGSSVVPSLFPFMVLSDFLVRSGFVRLAGKKIEPAARLLFRLPGSAGCAAAMSFIGGFPVGAKMTAQLFENGEITARQGRRMMLFCVNAGPAFVIGTVGTAMLSSRKAGLILFASMTLTSAAAGIVSRFFADKNTETSPRKNTTVRREGIAESVANSVQTMLEICGWVLLFSGLDAYVRLLPFKTAAGWITMLAEVTNGCLAAVERFPACVLALVLGWSGLAVHCQLLPYLKKLNMKISVFWAARLIIGGTATAVAYVLFRLFPCEVGVFSQASQIIPKPYSVSAPAAAAMLVLSSLMLVDIKSCTKEKGVL